MPSPITRQIFRSALECRAATASHNAYRGEKAQPNIVQSDCGYVELTRGNSSNAKVASDAPQQLVIDPDALFCSTESLSHHRIPVQPMISEIPTVIAEIGTHRFFDTVLEWVAQRIPFDIAEVFTFSTSSGLGPVTSQERGLPLVTMSRPYAEVYRQDPLFHAFCDHLPPGLYNPERLKRHYPLTTFFDTFYRYKDFGGELEFLVPHGDGRAAVIWLCWSKHSRAADRRKLPELEAAEPVLRACVQKHLSLPSLDLPGVYISENDRTAAPTVLTSHGLTSREMEVARCILQGDSAKDTGVRLCIAEGTVRIHRKSIYRKLNIGSVAELFALCNE
jgi:DNA-binding CsgD family transcriptional regulator